MTARAGSARKGIAETLVQYSKRVIGRDGTEYEALACGVELPYGLWQGWIEFIPRGGQAARSPRETIQPNRVDMLYWATGLSAVYLEGALDRALRPLRTVIARRPERPRLSFARPPLRRF